MTINTSAELSDDALILVIGTLMYRGVHGRDALALFCEDLRRLSVRVMTGACDGQFCMVIGEPTGRRFKVITDHTGIINMYVYRSGRRLVISSSSMAISTSYPVTLNDDAVAQFLRSGSVYGSGTIYNEIHLLEPASIHSFAIEPDGMKEHRDQYWQPPIEVQEGMSFDEARDSLMYTMLRSFRALPGDGVIYDLTAGYDSRLILSLISANRPFREIEIFVFGPPVSREVSLVGDYCRDLGLGKHHLELPRDWDERIWEYVQRSLFITDGEENIFVYAPILWAQEHKARNHAYAVNGLGGELYRDFWWFQEFFPSKRPANLDRLIDSRILQYEYDPSIFSSAWAGRMNGIRDIFRKEFENSIRDMAPGKTYNTLQIDNLYYRQKMWRWAGRTISSSNQVISMLTPLTTKACITRALSIPPRFKRNGRMVKGIIEELSPQLSGLKMLNGAPCQNITLRNVHQFIPLAADYGKRGARKVAQKLLNRTILVDRTISYQQADFFAALFREPVFRDNFRHDGLRTGKLYDRDAYQRFYEDAAGGRSLYYHQLGNLITLEMRMRNDNIHHEIK